MEGKTMHKNAIKKAAASLVAAAMAVNGAVVGTSTIFAADTVYEFEDATLTGTIEVVDFAGASGGKVAYMTESGTISLDIEVASAGMYTLVFYVQGEGGSKQQNLSINGVSQGVLAIPEATEMEPVSLTVKLPAGKSTVVIEKSWGWSRFDKLEIKSAEMPEIKATHTNLCNINATSEARSLFDYLNSVYGKNILSGQQEIYNYGHGGNFEVEFEYLNDLTGHYPAIRGFDFLNNANILYGSNDKTVDRMIDWANNKNGITTAAWHICVPKEMSGYKVGDHVAYEQCTYKPDETNFVTSNVLVEGTVEREFYLKSLENLVETSLKPLQEAGVPVIWRPLHEAEGGGGETGGWFWWAKDGSAVYKEIWKLTYDTLVNEYGINNLIWEWNSYNFPTSKNWYPGDEYVDIIGYDKYSCTEYLAENNWKPSYRHNDSAIGPTFYSLMEMYDSKKMIAMAENDCFSTVENLTSEKAGWLYFCTWYDGGGQTDFLSDPLFNTKEDTIEMYQSDYCITLDELPADLYKKEVAPVDPALTTTAVTTTPPVTTTRATTAADPNKNYGKVVYEELNGTFQITLPKESEEFYIVVDLPENIEYANGGLGVTIPLDGEYYWANIQWEAAASGAVKVNVKEDVFNITLGTEEITDEALLEKLMAELGKGTTYQGQIWYAQSGGKEASKDGIAIVDAYLMNESTTVPVTTGVIPSDTAIPGDANCDGVVEIADATLILQHIGNGDKYKLSAEGAVNADCYNPGSGITALDALAVQKLDAKVITSLPEIVED